MTVRSSSEHSGLVETFPSLHYVTDFPRCDYFLLAALCRLHSASSDWPHFASFLQVWSFVGDSSQYLRPYIVLDRRCLQNPVTIIDQ